MQGYKRCITIPSPSIMGRNGQRPRFLIIHGTAGGESAESVAYWFQNPKTRASTHYIVGKAGEIIQCVDEALAAWGNGEVTQGADDWWKETKNPNFCSISIEVLKHNPDNSDRLTPEQQVATFKLVLDICKRWQIPMRWADRNGGITGHYSIDPVNKKRCPGTFPWDDLFSFLDEGGDVVIDMSSPRIADYYIEMAYDRWRCRKTGFDIHGGILSFYMKVGKTGLCGLTHLGLSISSEIMLSKNPYATVQAFERGLVLFDPKRKLDNPEGAEGDCYLGHISDLKLNPLMAGQQKELEALQKQIKEMVAKLQEATSALATSKGELEALKKQPVLGQVEDPSIFGLVHKIWVLLLVKVMGRKVKNGEPH